MPRSSGRLAEAPPREVSKRALRVQCTVGSERVTAYPFTLCSAAPSRHRPPRPPLHSRLPPGAPAPAAPSPQSSCPRSAALPLPRCPARLRGALPAAPPAPPSACKQPPTLDKLGKSVNALRWCAHSAGVGASSRKEMKPTPFSAASSWRPATQAASRSPSVRERHRSTAAASASASARASSTRQCGCVFSRSSPRTVSSSEARPHTASAPSATQRHWL